MLADWIAAGAAGPRRRDPTIERIEVLPAARGAEAEGHVRLVVLAWYTDGHAEDVTRLAKFLSSEDLVADVDEDGQVKVGGHGEAAVSAMLHQPRRHRHRHVAPFPNAVDATGVRRVAAGHNFIDEHVLRKLRELRLPPSPQCTDAEFIRRAYLDAAGILPTPEEVGQSSSPTSRRTSGRS